MARGKQWINWIKQFPGAIFLSVLVGLPIVFYCFFDPGGPKPSNNLGTSLVTAMHAPSKSSDTSYEVAVSQQCDEALELFTAAFWVERYATVKSATHRGLLKKLVQESAWPSRPVGARTSCSRASPAWAAMPR